MDNEKNAPTEEKDKKTVGDGVPDVPAETAAETPSEATEEQAIQEQLRLLHLM